MNLGGLGRMLSSDLAVDLGGLPRHGAEAQLAAVAPLLPPGMPTPEPLRIPLGNANESFGLGQVVASGPMKLSIVNQVFARKWLLKATPLGVVPSQTFVSGGTVRLTSS